MSKPTKESETEVQEKTVKARMSFFLDQNVLEINEISIKESEFGNMKESLIKGIQDKEDKGYLVIHGTKSSPLDITMIPVKRLLCLKLTVESIE